jgi:hypothetical protein
MQPWEFVHNPLAFVKFGWPDVVLYNKQREVMLSVRDNDETYVPAANMTGKDYISGLIVLWFFLTRRPCKCILTSAKSDHLRVLFGEIGRFIQTCQFPLTVDRGGPLVVNHHELRWEFKGRRCTLSYVRGMVAAPDSIASMQGHHVANIGDGVPRTLFVADEASSVPDDYYTMASTWARRMLVIGNTWPCRNFFWRAVRGGDVPAPA